MCKGSDLENPKILLLTPTWVAAVLINGIHRGLQINIRGKLFVMNDRRRAILRNKLFEVKIVVIDEIRMVSGMLLYHVN